MSQGQRLDYSHLITLLISFLSFWTLFGHMAQHAFIFWHCHCISAIVHTPGAGLCTCGTDLPTVCFYCSHRATTRTTHFQDVPIQFILMVFILNSCQTIALMWFHYEENSPCLSIQTLYCITESLCSWCLHLEVFPRLAVVTSIHRRTRSVHGAIFSAGYFKQALWI